MARNKKDKQAFILFIVTFFVSLIVITYFIKSMSPDVDVEIGGEQVESVSGDSDSDVKQAIDDRLRWIQMEDNMPGVSKHVDAGEDSDIEKATDSSNEKKHKQLAPIEYVNPQNTKQVAPPIPNTTKQEPHAKAFPFKMTKVYVGSYATIEQAIQAQNQLMNASVSISPFVKEVDGKFVLQAGSFANAEKAESVAKDINALGFSARVVKE